MTNNAAELALRHIAVGRANWKFAGSDVGGARAAVLYTVIRTATAVGLDPREYLLDVLPRLHAREAGADISDLLPAAWAAERKAKKTEADAPA